jgi:hypothetical protein
VRPFRQEIELGTTLSEAAARHELASALTELNFTSSSNPFLRDATFERGSILQNGFVLGPRNIASRVEARFESQSDGSTRVRLRMEVRPLGQFPMETDRRYWRAELVAMSRAVRGLPIEWDALAKAHGQAVARTLLAIVAVLPVVAILTLVMLLLVRP